jgi:hypothetical protein
MTISDEAVEPAAEALWDMHALEGMLYGFEVASDEMRAAYRNYARAALEAAAPHLMAEAWHECASNLVDEYGTPLKVISNGNPYRHAGAGE